ncbi:MAG: ECF transporter S component [Oscillospiraceae bacterium]
MKQKIETKKLVLMGLFVAIEIALAFTPLGFIPLGFTRATTIHIPVMLGAIVMGPKAGAILGAVFGITSLVINTVTPTVTSFVFSPFYSGGNMWSLVIVLVPRILIGVTAYYTFKFMIKASKNKIISYSVAGVVGSLTNTILVMGGIYLFFGKQYASAKSLPFEELFGVIMGIVGINGVPEAIVAAILVAAICPILLKYFGNKKINVEEQSF